MNDDYNNMSTVSEVPQIILTKKTAFIINKRIPNLQR